MSSVFDQFNQQNQPTLGPENDYKQALALVKPAEGAGATWPTWQNNAGKASKSGGGDSPDDTPEATSSSPEASAPLNQPAQGQLKPQEAMAMAPAPGSAPATWPNFSGGGGGGGGGGDSMSQMASIASMFI